MSDHVYDQRNKQQNNQKFNLNMMKLIFFKACEEKNNFLLHQKPFHVGNMQGDTQEELPEVLLGTCRLNHLDISQAVQISSW